MTTNLNLRQYPLAAVADCGVANIGADNGYTITIPPGGLFDSLTIDTMTAFDGTTNTLTVSDGTTTFANAVDVKSTGRETVTGIGKFYPNGGVLSVTLAQTGTATVGRSIVVANYVGLNRQNEVQN